MQPPERRHNSIARSTAQSECGELSTGTKISRYTGTSASGSCRAYTTLAPSPGGGSVLCAGRLVYARLQRRGAAVTNRLFETSCREYRGARRSLSSRVGRRFECRQERDRQRDEQQRPQRDHRKRLEPSAPCPAHESGRAEREAAERRPPQPPAPPPAGRAGRKPPQRSPR